MKSMKILITVFLIAILTLTACNFEKPKPTITAEIANPASVFCKENGGTEENRQAADGSVAGFCLFSDGSECDEWAYFRGECKVGDSLKPTEAVVTPGSALQPGTEAVTDWWGVIKSTGAGAQYDDYFERQDLGQTYISFGIDSMDPAVQAQVVALRDNGRIVHLYGTLFSNMPDVNGSQIQVDRIELRVEDAGSYMPPGKTDEIADWRGVIKSTPTGAQYDDYFELWTNGQVIYFGIDAMDSAVKSQIEALRDSGKVVHLYGTLFSNVPDYNGSQIQPDRIVVEE